MRFIFDVFFLQFGVLINKQITPIYAWRVSFSFRYCVQMNILMAVYVTVLITQVMLLLLS